jgi:purine-binding chemotaxis protein CheW
VRALILPIGDELYALPIESVRLVIEHPAPTRLPTAPARMLGLLNVQGALVPMLDTAALLDNGTIVAPPYAAVIDVRGARGALAATAMPLTGELGEPIGRADVAAGLGTYAFGDQLVVLLDVEALFSRTGAVR